MIAANEAIKSFLKTDELSKGWYLLSNRDVTVLIDTIKIRIYRIFVHGKFGTIQQIIYDTDGYEQTKGYWGCLPYIHIGNEIFYPFYHSFDFYKYDCPPGEVILDQANNTLTLKGIYFISENFEKSRAVIIGGAMEIKLINHEIKIKVKYPLSAHKTGIHVCLYPLYDQIEADGRKDTIEYLTGKNVVGPRNVLLCDSKGRMPAICLSSKNQSLNMTAERDLARGEAYKLHVDFLGWALDDEFSILLINNPVMIDIAPLSFAGHTQKMIFYCNEKPEVFINNILADIEVKKAHSKNMYTANMSLGEGAYKLKVQTSFGKTERDIWIVGDWRDKVLATGKAVKNVQFKHKPVLGVFPHNIAIKDCTACPSGSKVGNEKEKAFSVSYVEYGIREVHSLVASSVISGDKTYLELAKTGMSSLRNLGYLREDGGRLAIHTMHEDGSINMETAQYLRPASFGNIISSYLSCVKGYRYFNDNNGARECLEWASEYAITLLAMQHENGCFFERYHYPDLEVSNNNVFGATVCPWLIFVWELSEEINCFNEKLSVRLKKMCIRAADFLLNLKPSLLRISGAEGEHVNSMEAQYSASVLCLIKFLYTGDIQYKKYAEDLYIKGVLQNNMYIDQADNFLFPCNWWHSIYFVEKGSYPPGLIGKGGMFDLTLSETSIALKKYLNLGFADTIMKTVLASRIASGLFENGLPCVYQVSVPNFFYRNEIVTEDCDFGGIGMAGIYFVLTED